MINKSVIFLVWMDSYRVLYSMGVVLINSFVIVFIREGRVLLFWCRFFFFKNKMNSFICLMLGLLFLEEGEWLFNENKKVEKKIK